MITRLYHYQPFVPTFLRSVLVEHRLHFSDPRHFNDPWDCKPFYRVDHLDDVVEQERLIEWYKTISRERVPALSEVEIERRASHFRAHPEELVRKTIEMSGVMSETIGERFRVYCMTPHPDSELMWAHYAKSHSGVCLEFDATHLFISTAQPVRYSEHYPKPDLVGSDNMAEVVAPILTKSAAWSYEQKYRIVSQERSDASSDVLITTDDGVVLLPNGALKSVIVGCLADSATHEAVRNMAVEGGRNVVVKRIHRAQDRYQLVVSD